MLIVFGDAYEGYFGRRKGIDVGQKHGRALMHHCFPHVVVLTQFQGVLKFPLNLIWVGVATMFDHMHLYPMMQK